jgi:hypothetical protein
VADVDLDAELAQRRERRPLGTIGAADAGPELDGDPRVAAHPRAADADEMQPAPAPRPLVAHAREPYEHRNLRAPSRVRYDVHHVRPTTWRIVPTLLLIIGALALGAVTARADAPAPPAAPAQSAPAAASSSSATS